MPIGHDPGLTALVALQPPAEGGSPLGRDFGAGLGVYGRHGPDTDLCQLFVARVAQEASAPFTVRRWSDVFTPMAHAELLAWLVRRCPWHVSDGGFYRADVFGLGDDADIPAPLRPLLGTAGRPWAERLASNAFGERLRLHGPIALHRMRPGQGIGVHSDKPLPEEETHRIVVTACARMPRHAGGHFVMLAGERAADARVVIPLQSNAALAFRLDARSYHAITTVREGARFSIVMSFRPT